MLICPIVIFIMILLYLKMIFDPSDTGHNFTSLSTGVQYRFKLWTVGMYNEAGNSYKTEVNVSTCKCIISLKSARSLLALHGNI